MLWTFQDAAEYASVHTPQYAGEDAWYMHLDANCGFKFYKRELSALVCAARQKFLHKFHDFAPAFGEFGEFKQNGRKLWGIVTERADAVSRGGIVAVRNIPNEFLSNAFQLLANAGFRGRNPDSTSVCYRFDLHWANIGIRRDSKIVPIDFGFGICYENETTLDESDIAGIIGQRGLTIEEFLEYKYARP